MALHRDVHSFPLLPQALYVTFDWVFKEQGMSHFPCMCTDRSAEDGVYGPCGMNVYAQWKEIPPLCCILPIGEWRDRDKRLNYLFAAPGFLELLLMSHHSLVSWWFPWCPTRYSILGVHTLLVCSSYPVSLNCSASSGHRDFSAVW